jgi:hypothetical protein
LHNLRRDGVEDDQERGQPEQEDRAIGGTDETGPVAPGGHYPLPIDPAVMANPQPASRGVLIFF